MDPLAKDLLRGLMSRYYRDQWPLAQAIIACAIGYLRIYGEKEIADSLEKTVRNMKVPK